MRLNHVTLPADDLAAAIAFYEALGLKLIVLSALRYARIEVDGFSTLSLEVTPDAAAGSAEIFLHCDDVDADYAAARARGVAFDTPPTDQSYLWRTATTRDPAGNRIVLFTAGAAQHFPPWRIVS
jgi:catechol 2,3-dioxygenase-like lactoylglutathione lyase family enzyme